MSGKNRLSIPAERLAVLDRHLVDVLAKRTLALVHEVAMIKAEDRIALLRSATETERLDAIAAYAKEKGLNPEFARTMLYIICLLYTSDAADE